MSPDIEKARERISNYSNQERLHETKLKAALDASLQWLPNGGKEALASDILDATTDDKLHEIFFNILTILAWPGKWSLDRITEPVPLTDKTSHTPVRSKRSQNTPRAA